MLMIDIYQHGLHTHILQIEMLHSIAQPTEGTVNNFVDGRKATDVLRSLDPEALRLMSSVDVQYGVKYDGAKTRRAEMAQPIIR